MGTGWTAERRARQAELIRTWKPWERSTGPRTTEGKERTARNGFKGGHRAELRELAKAMRRLLQEQHQVLVRTGNDVSISRDVLQDDPALTAYLGLPLDCGAA